MVQICHLFSPKLKSRIIFFCSPYSTSCLSPLELIYPSTGLSNLSSSSLQSPSSPSPWFSQILNLILQSKSESLESKLDSYCQIHLLRLSPAFTSCLLRSPSLHSHPDKCLQFFRWSSQQHQCLRIENQEDYDYHTVESYVSLIHAFSSVPSDRENNVACVIKQLVCEMRSLGLSLTSSASVELMKGLGIVGLVEELLWVWRQMKCAGLQPSLVHYNCLMDGLVNSGFVHSAEKVFYSMHEKPDILSHNILIKGYCNSRQTAKAVGLFKGMQKRAEVLPDEVTYLFLMQSYHVDHLYHDCVYLYQEMEDRGLEIPPDVHGLVITGLCKEGKPFEGLKVFEEMLKRGCQPNVPIYTALIDSFTKSGREDQAMSLFERMKNDGLTPDEVIYSAVINCLCNFGKLDEAMEYFRFCEKVGDAMINVVMYASLITAFGKAGLVEQAQKLFVEMTDKGLLPDSYCYNTLINILVKEGRVNEALDQAKRMEKDGVDPTVYTYTMLIHGLFTKHRNEEAIKLWSYMVNEKGIMPTNAAFRVLSRGLCLSGKFNIACKVLDEIAPMGLVVENAHEEMFNVLCKAGRFKQACKLADEIVGKGREIPGRVRTAMINAFRKAGNADLAIKLMHSKIGIGYERFGSIKRRVKFQTLFD
ncbi:Pentatricopeptide repeat-containing protein [Rhynchospora pubera]|uniref:Pentatricopeptide repeat-containing protein n=1 Tax=Rhynchospora pubera TaxID=906938 RepID=A0AAV8EDR8_9POAL|nr:Pentatricopeptide repeat-containing protein [Rhynchospora pubera]